MLKSFYLRALLTALPVVLSAGLQAQTAASASGAGAVSAGALTTDAAAAPAFSSPTTGRSGAPQSAMPLQGTAQDAAKSGGDATDPEAARVRPPSRVSVPSQFQRFVQESTCRLLPMYGRDLFDAPQA